MFSSGHFRVVAERDLWTNNCGTCILYEYAFFHWHSLHTDDEEPVVNIFSHHISIGRSDLANNCASFLSGFFVVYMFETGDKRCLKNILRSLQSDVSLHKAQHPLETHVVSPWLNIFRWITLQDDSSDRCPGARRRIPPEDFRRNHTRLPNFILSSCTCFVD